MRFALIAAAFVFAPAYAQAQATFAEPVPGDASVVSQCLTAHEGYLARLQCVGAVTRLCHDQGGEAAETTAGAMQCAQREGAIWRDLLQTSAAQLREREGEAQRILLEHALEKGDAWGLARCGYARSQFEGGSLARVLSAQCWRDTTAERAIELYTRLRALEHP